MFNSVLKYQYQYVSDPFCVVNGNLRIWTEEPFTHTHRGEAIQMSGAELLQVL